MSLNYINLDKTEAYNKLAEQEPEDLREILTAERIKKLNCEVGGGLTFNYAAKFLSDEGFKILQELSDEQQLIEKYSAILNGEYMNTGENRRVLHHLTRGQQLNDVVHEGVNLRDFYKGEMDKVYDFAAKVHSGEIKGSTGKKFTSVVQIGIGGSDLGPRALTLALKNVVPSKMEAFFISNVDPDDANEVIEKIDPETTLFILVSKSGTTQETLANRNFVLEKSSQKNIAGYDASKHMIAVTSQTSPLAKSSDVLASFFMDDFIGGRYSSTSAVGGALMTLCFGKEVFEDLLAGAAEADKLALNKDITKNSSLIDALMGVYERNILDMCESAILPYSQALSRFPAHLQQADMESNGKCVNRDGDDIEYPTGPVIFGEPGTNGQHSFYQLLHQGTDIVPLQFIGFKKSQIDFDLDYEGSDSQTKLKANLVAQIVAFAKGQDDDNPNKNFYGNRPSTLIYGDQLTPKALGALLAHYENKIMFQGFIWNLNSFDQEGVQLGKVLTGKVLAGGDMDEALTAFSNILDI